ncbi:hypothetical protein [Lacrimispora indolis]|uniref:hypothetical protein n=1 Tax=Lacrimispora indolis TaxID=69825 RepID=UPI0003F878CB|nr:hypothetical protein [[Clostridium] methoxybenzovorans]
MDIKINDDNVIVTVLRFKFEHELIDLIKNLVTSLCSDIEIPTDIIGEFNIDPIKVGDGYFGRISCTSFDPLKISIIVKNTVIWDYFDDNKSRKEKELAKAIIIHELYHCKENYITSLNTNLEDIVKHPPITTTELLMFDIGHIQFSEYYAHRNSSSFSYDVKNDMQLIHNTHDELLALQECARNQQHDFSFNYEKIHTFIKYIVKYTAIFSCSHDEKFRVLLIILEEDYPLIYKYVNYISETLNIEYIDYPKDISKAKFSSIGRALLTIYQYYNLYFTDENVQNTFNVNYIIKTE